MDPADPIHSNIPFRNIRIHYSDSKDTTAMHSLGDLYIVTDDSGSGGTLVSAHRPFQFIDTSNPKVIAELPKASLESFGGSNILDTADTREIEAILSNKRQAAKDAELKRSKALSDNALKEMLVNGFGTVSPYTLVFTSHTRNCDACGKYYVEAEAESNGNCCQSCVCCPDCGTVLEPAMNSDTKAAWVHCRNCHWRSAVQKDVASLNTYLMDLRLWGGNHENIRRKAEAAIRKAVKDNEKEISVSNDVLFERNKIMGFGLGGTISSLGGATVKLMSTAGILNSANEIGALTSAEAAVESSSSNNTDAVITEIKKTSARSKRVMDFDAKLREKNNELLAHRATNYEPKPPQANWWLGQNASQFRGINESTFDATFGTTILNETVGDESAQATGGTTTSIEDLKSASIIPLSNYKNIDNDDFEGPRPAPMWSDAVKAIKGAAVTGASQGNNFQHGVLSTKTMLSADTLPKGSITANSLQRMTRQNDGIGSTRWIRHAPLSNRFAISHPMSGHLLYTPTPKEVMDSASLSSFLSSKRNEALANNANAGRLLPWVRIASTQFSEAFATQLQNKNPDASKKRMYCYLWNIGECDIKVTHINVVGTNGCTAVCGFEVAERLREAKDQCAKLQREKKRMGGVDTNEEETTEEESTITENTIHASSTMSPSGKPSTSFGGDPSSPLIEALKEFRHQRTETAEGFENAAETAATAIAAVDQSIDMPPPGERDKPTPAPSPEYTGARDTTENTATNQSSTDTPNQSSPTRNRATSGSTAAASSPTSPQHSMVVYLESREKDIESLNTSYVVSDRQAVALQEQHFISDCSKVLFYLDVQLPLADSGEAGSYLPGKKAATKMVALQISAVATVGAKRSKLNIQYNSYILFE